MTSRVRSSCVGPSPPVEMTRSARPQAILNAAMLSARSSATVVWKPTGMPISASRRLSHWQFVSRFCPLVNSLPMERISAFMGGLALWSAGVPPARLRVEMRPGRPRSTEKNHPGVVGVDRVNRGRYAGGTMRTSYYLVTAAGRGGSVGWGK